MAKKDYTNWDRKDLIKEIEQLRKRKKYGLVWEDKPENVVEQCKTELPVLEEVKNKEIITDPDKPVNLLIEGDNYHALSVLNYTHKGKIDAIYIDPPYNTGAKDWKYNNDYVDSEDPYRHTKWISFMAHRLKIAKNLLTNKGIICITIDDYEVPRLTMLMEEIFGEFNHLGTVIIRNNPAGRSTVKGISITHEYAIFFGKSKLSQVGRLPRNQKQKDRYNHKDEKGYFEWVNFRKPGGLKKESPKMYYPFFLSKKSLRIPSIKWDEDKNEWELLEKPKKDEKIIYPVDDYGKEKRWRWGIDRAKKEINELKPKLLKGKLHVYLKGRMTKDDVLPMTWWDKKEYSATAYGTNLLKDIFTELQIFSYPKSIFAVKDCLRVLSNNKNAIFLDFFAGSGTTGHATLELNNDDGGKRNFILCTNNESGISEDVCHPRIEKVIKGYSHSKKQVIGLGGNLKYFKTSFVKNSISRDDLKIR